MFGLFKKEENKPSVTPEDKDWVEKNLIWLVENFGLERVMGQPFIFPTRDIFPYENLKDPDQFIALLEQLCGLWDIDPGCITARIFDDFKSKQWISYSPPEKFKDAAGYYTKEE